MFVCAFRAQPLVDDMTKRRSSSRSSGSSGSRSSRSKSGSSRSSRSRSGSSRSSRRRRSSRRTGIQLRLPEINLTLDQWLAILGGVLLAIAALTALSFLSTNHGSITGRWLEALRQAFGWGAYLVPLLAGALGLWLVLRYFEYELPHVSPLQIGGVLLGYLVLLVTLHFSAATILHGGDLAGTADEGIGGGHLGAAFTRVL